MNTDNGEAADLAAQAQFFSNGGKSSVHQGVVGDIKGYPCERGSHLSAENADTLDRSEPEQALVMSNEIIEHRFNPTDTPLDCNSKFDGKVHENKKKISSRGFPVAVHRSKCSWLRRRQIAQRLETKADNSIMNPRTPKPKTIPPPTTTTLPIKNTEASADVLRMLKNLSIDEIADAQNQLEKQLNPALLNKLRNRGKKKLASRISADNRDLMGKHVSISKINTISAQEDTDLSKVCTEDALWKAVKKLPEDSTEYAKLSWMLEENSETTSAMSSSTSEIRRKFQKTRGVLEAPLRNILGDEVFAEATIQEDESLRCSKLRIDFAGKSIQNGNLIPSHFGLHHHGDNPNDAGYTLQELLDLSRSQFPAQRVTALTTLKAFIQNYDKSSLLPNPLLQLLPSAITVALQFPKHLSATLAAMEVTALLFPTIECINDYECCYLERFRGHECITAVASKRSKSFNSPLIPLKTIIDSKLVHRIYPVLSSVLGNSINNVNKSSQRIIYLAVLLLTELSRSSLTLASEVAHSQNLLTILTKHFLSSNATLYLKQTQFEENEIHSISTDKISVAVASLVRVLCQSGRHVTIALEKRGILDSLRRITCLNRDVNENAFSGSTSLIKIQLEALRAWRCSLSYGLPSATDALVDLFPQLVGWMRQSNVINSVLGPAIYALFESVVPVLAEAKNSVSNPAERSKGKGIAIATELAHVTQHHEQLHSATMSGVDSALITISRALQQFGDVSGGKNCEDITNILSESSNILKVTASAMHLVASHFALLAGEEFSASGDSVDSRIGIRTRARRVQEEVVSPLAGSLILAISVHKLIPKGIGSQLSVQGRSIIDNCTHFSIGLATDWIYGFLRMLKSLGQSCFGGLSEAFRVVPESLRPLLQTPIPSLQSLVDMRMTGLVKYFGAKENMFKKTFERTSAIVSLGDHSSLIRFYLELMTFLRPSPGSVESQNVALNIIEALNIGECAEALALELIRDHIISPNAAHEAFSPRVLSTESRRELVSFFYHEFGGNDTLQRSSKWWSEWRQRPSQRPTLRLRRLGKTLTTADGFESTESGFLFNTCNVYIPPLVNSDWPLAPLLSIRSSTDGSGGSGKFYSASFIKGALALADAGSACKWICRGEDSKTDHLCLFALCHVALTSRENLQMPSICNVFRRLWKRWLSSYIVTSPICDIENAIGKKRCEQFLQGVITQLLSESFDSEIVASVLALFLLGNHRYQYRDMILTQIGKVGLLHIIDNESSNLAAHYEMNEHQINKDKNVVWQWADLLWRQKVRKESAPFLYKMATRLVMKKIADSFTWDTKQLVRNALNNAPIEVIVDVCNAGDPHDVLSVFCFWKQESASSDKNETLSQIGKDKLEKILDILQI